MLERLWIKGNPSTLLGECKLVQSLWRTVWRFLKKLKLELPLDAAIPLLGIYPGKTLNQKDKGTPMFIAALFINTIAKPWKQPKCPSTDEWIKKMWCIHTHTHSHTLEYYSSIKKKSETMPFAATWMDPEIIILNEVSQRKTRIIWYLICEI